MYSKHFKSTDFDSGIMCEWIIKAPTWMQILLGMIENNKISKACINIFF